MPIWMHPVVLTVLSIGALHAAVRCNQSHIDRFFMGVFRDLGRYKAKKRRYANQNGLMLQTLLRQDDPLEDIVALERESEQSVLNGDLETYTEDDLMEYGDGLEGRPILMGILGWVFDVSKGAKFYGPDGKYGQFAGNDVTYSLSTGCHAPACIGKSTETLSENDLKEGKRWLSFFYLHDKYPLVGKLESDHVKVLMDELIERASKEDVSDLPPILQDS